MLPAVAVIGMTATAPGTHLRICYYLEKAGPCKRMGRSLPIDYPQYQILLTYRLGGKEVWHPTHYS